MAKLKEKIENVLNETRIMVLGIQILIGFDFRSFFEPRFREMQPYAQYMQLAALALMLSCLGVLMIPAPYHRIVLHGRNTAQLHRFGTATVTFGLLPFAASMGFSFFLGAHWVLGKMAAAVFGAGALAITLVAWYGVEVFARIRRRGTRSGYAMLDPLSNSDMEQEQETDLTTRVQQVLIECRVVLPGAQALLGFQLIIMWMTAFESIPQLWKILHLASLASVGICTILLITPAAYHRIVEEGEDSEMLHHITARLLLWAMVFLALGMAGDFYIVCRVTGLGPQLSAGLALALLAFFYGAWFGYTFWKKRQMHNNRLTQSHLNEQKAA